MRATLCSTSPLAASHAAFCALASVKLRSNNCEEINPCSLSCTDRSASRCAESAIAQTCFARLDAIKDKQFAGKVKRIAPYVLELEKQARTVEVEVTFTELPKEENLLVGYSADIEVVHKVQENVLRIPTQHLMEGKKVLLYKSDGKIEERVVATGLSNWQFTEIVSGLQEGDQIIASLDRTGLKPGAKVKPEAPQNNQISPAK